MTGQQDPDARIAAFFRVSQPDLPDRTFDAVRREIHATRQLGAFGRMRVPDVGRGSWFAAAAVAVLAIGIAMLDLRPGGGPGGPPNPSPTPSVRAAAASSLPPASAQAPTRFTSTLYGYSLTLPGGWLAAQAALRWDGVNQPGPDAEADKFDGPEQIAMWGFAGPFKGDLAAFTSDRIGANARDHADTCPRAAPEVNEPFQVGGAEWELLGWNCGALINQAITVHSGVAYAITFRDLGIRTASDPTDRALFLSILDSIELPATPK